MAGTRPPVAFHPRCWMRKHVCAVYVCPACACVPLKNMWVHPTALWRVAECVLLSVGVWNNTHGWVGCCFSLGDAHKLHCEPPHTPVATSAFDNAQNLDSVHKIMPLSQDKVWFASGFTVPQTVEPVWEGVCSFWIQTWGLSVPRSLSECKWRTVLPCEKGCISKARKSVKEQWRWHYTLSYQTRLFKSHIIESSLLVNRIFCQLARLSKTPAPSFHVWKRLWACLRNKKWLFSSFLNGLCGVV